MEMPLCILLQLHEEVSKSVHIQGFPQLLDSDQQQGKTLQKNTCRDSPGEAMPKHAEAFQYSVNIFSLNYQHFSLPSFVLVTGAAPFVLLLINFCETEWLLSWESALQLTKAYLSIVSKITLSMFYNTNPAYWRQKLDDSTFRPSSVHSLGVEGVLALVSISLLP